MRLGGSKCIEGISRSDRTALDQQGPRPCILSSEASVLELDYLKLELKTVRSDFERG